LLSLFDLDYWLSFSGFAGAIDLIHISVESSLLRLFYTLFAVAIDYFIVHCYYVEQYGLAELGVFAQNDHGKLQRKSAGSGDGLARVIVSLCLTNDKIAWRC
jgi:hypothetical protein